MLGYEHSLLVLRVTGCIIKNFHEGLAMLLTLRIMAAAAGCV